MLERTIPLSLSLSLCSFTSNSIHLHSTFSGLLKMITGPGSCTETHCPPRWLTPVVWLKPS